jgi:signal transduction histidine kinase
MSERELTTKVLKPLLYSLGYDKVDYHGGSYEEGKDLICWKRDELDQVELCVAQVKKVRPSAAASDSQNFSEIVNQLQPATEKRVPYVDGQEYLPSIVYFITPFQVDTRALRTRFEAYSSLRQHGVKIIDGPLLAQLLKKHHPTLALTLSGGDKSEIIVNERLQNILYHELRQAVHSVARRTGDIVRFLKEDMYSIPRQISGSEELLRFIGNKVAFMYKDLLAFQNTLINIADLLRTDSFRELVSSGIDPLFYLIRKNNGVDFTVASSKINLKSLLVETLKVVSRDAELSDKAVNYSITGFSNGLTINSNETILTRILLNLLSNAFKYSRADASIDIQVEYTRHSLLIHITNTAISLPPEEREMIFENGFRGSNAGTIPGEGMGLSISRRLCEFLDGSLELDLQPTDAQGQRARFDFIVSLPRINVCS